MHIYRRAFIVFYTVWFSVKHHSYQGFQTVPKILPLKHSQIDRSDLFWQLITFILHLALTRISHVLLHVPLYAYIIFILCFFSFLFIFFF